MSPTTSRVGAALCSLLAVGALSTAFRALLSITIADEVSFVALPNHQMLMALQENQDDRLLDKTDLALLCVSLSANIEEPMHTLARPRGEPPCACCPRRVAPRLCRRPI